VYDTAPRIRVTKLYSVTKPSASFYRQSVLSDAKNRYVLECGCGTGSNAIAFARHGAQVVAIDISEVAIGLAKENAIAQRVEVDFRAMNVEAMDFSDATFDMVCGRSILHHLRTNVALSEITRVLKPDGKAVFLEPMGHNVLVNLFRRLTPGLRTEDEHPLLMSDIRLAHIHFESVKAHFYHLTSLLALPLRNTPGFVPLVSRLETVDGLILKTVPWLSRYAWIVVLVLERPRNQ
jgi:SAM-dependent methyltransferase